MGDYGAFKATQNDQLREALDLEREKNANLTETVRNQHVALCQLRLAVHNVLVRIDDALAEGP